MKIIIYTFFLIFSLPQISISWAQEVKYYRAGELPSEAEVAQILGGKSANTEVKKKKTRVRTKSFCDDCGSDDAPSINAETADNQALAPPETPERVTAGAMTISPLRAQDEAKELAVEIIFELNSYQIVPSSFAVLDRIVKGMASSNSVIQVQGHTDASGSSDFNFNLSKKRAESVKNYMTKRGISGSRLITVGFAATRPLNKTDLYDASNRRVQFAPN